MQYILSEEEYNNMVTKETMNDRITIYEERIDKAEKFILTKEGVICRHEDNGLFYCDNCPLSPLRIGTCIKLQKFSK